MSIRTKTCWGSFVALAIILPTVALASVDPNTGELTYEFLAPLPGAGVNATSVGPFLNAAIVILIGITGVISVIRMVICGFALLLSPNPGEREHAKTCVLLSILGILLALSAFIILQEINPLLTRNTFAPAPIVGGAGY